MTATPRAAGQRTGIRRRLAAAIALVALVAACNPASLFAPPGLTREAAIGIALQTFPMYTTNDVMSAEPGTIGSFIPPALADRLANVLDHQGWRIRLGRQPSPTGGQGTEVIVDATDGKIVLTSDWAS
jgi:hypothetical protein